MVGFIARANDDSRAFSLLAMVVSLFETGYLEHRAGLFDALPAAGSRGLWQPGGISEYQFAMGRAAADDPRARV